MDFFKRLFQLRTESNAQSNNIKQKVEDYFAYVLTIYNDYVEEYNKNKAHREIINKNTDMEAYIRNIDNGTRLTLKAIQHIKLAPYIYDLPKPIQQYMFASKTQFTLSLEHYAKRDKVIKKILTENENGNAAMMEHADEILAKADQHLYSAINYMEKARELL